MDGKEATDYYQDLSERIVPKRLIDKVRGRVIGHEDNLEDLVTALSFGVNRCIKVAQGVEPDKMLRPSAVLLMGPTGTGKSYSAEVVAKAAGLKLFSFDVSKMTGEGWKGASMSDYLSEVADYQDEHPGEICMVLFDEFDKAVRKNTKASGADDGFGPERSFLKVLEGGECVFTHEGQRTVTKTIDLDLIQFILGGAFTGVDALVRKRLSIEQGIADGGIVAMRSVVTMTKNELRANVTIDDIEEWGIMAELCGRIGQIVSFGALSADELIEIALTQTVPEFNSMLPDGVKVRLSEEAAQYAAAQAIDADKGARGMLNQVERQLMPVWRASVEDIHVVGATLAVADGKYKIDYVYGERRAEGAAFGVSTGGIPAKYDSGARRLARKWLSETYSKGSSYPAAFNWLAEMVDEDALSNIVYQGKDDKLAEILLRGSDWDGRAYAAARELLVSCVDYLVAFYADQPQYRNLAYALGMMQLVPLQHEECTVSPLDIVMRGTVKENSFEGFKDWVVRRWDLYSAGPSKREFKIAERSIDRYGTFGECPRSVQKLAAEVILLRVAKAELDENEHNAFKSELEELVGKCASAA